LVGATHEGATPEHGLGLVRNGNHVIDAKAQVKREFSFFA